MTKTLKKFTAILLIAICMICSIFGGLNLRLTQNAAYSEEPEITLEAGDNANKAGDIAIKALEFLFGDDKGAIGVKSIFKNIFTDIGYVNTAVSFLKLIGVMKDATAEALANIQRQLENITERLSIMDAKLDTIISKMDEIIARQDFIDRTNNAKDYRKYFQDFKRDYCTNGLNAFITDFDSMRIDAMKDWYNAETSAERVGVMIDNSKVVLIYDLNEDGSFSLRYTTANGVPADYEGRYLILSEEFLPTKSDVAVWHVDNYRSEIESFIYNKILTNFVDLESQNFPAFTPDGVFPGGLLTPELIAQTAEEAVNVIVYRTTAAAINESSRFANNVLDSFNNYSYNLLRPEGGFDSMIRALYYTHSFEYEVSDMIEELFAELVFETTYYGAFVKDVIAMSNDISKEKKDAFDKSYCNAIIKLEDTKNSALTGKPNYCYLTNTVLYYGGINMSSNASIHTYLDGSCDGYTSYAAQGFSVSLSRFDTNGKQTAAYKSQLIGGDAATLISMTLRANGIVADHDYLVKNLVGSTSFGNSGTIVVSLNDETNLPFDSTFALKVKKLIGDYFTEGSTISMRSMPANTTTDYVHWHRMIQGSTFNFGAGALTSNNTLAAIALYGEHHSYWWDDESAFMSGSVSSSVSQNYRQECTKNYGKKQYENYYNLTTKFNCILQEPLKPQIAQELNAVNPLFAFRSETGYIEPTIYDDTTTPETSSSAVPENDWDKAVYNAVMTLPAIYRAIIIIPCVIVGLAAIGLTVFFIVRAYRKKKNK